VGVHGGHRRRRTRNVRAPVTAPMTGAVTYIHKSLNFHEMIAGPNDLAGFIDPPETGLKCKAKQIDTRKNKK
jgi:hypothetical protein